MKKIILALLFIPIVGFSQTFGKYTLENASIYNDKTVFIKNKWYKNKDGDFCIKIYNQTPIGIKTIISDVKTIIYSNNLNFEKPFLDNSYLSSIVKDIEDYEMLNITINSESSEVHKEWRLADSTYLILNLKKEGYEINLLKL